MKARKVLLSLIVITIATISTGYDDYAFSGDIFSGYQAIPTKAAETWESFTIDGETYLAVANMRNNLRSYNINSVIYKWSGSSFTEFQAIPTNGAADWESFSIDGKTYLAVANHHDDVTSYNTDSKIYEWNGSIFVEIQSFETHGAMDWESFTIDGETYLASANSYNGSTFTINSKIYRWDGTSFVKIQDIETSGAADWESFSISGETYLAVANYRDDSTFAIIYSKIYKWNETISKFEEIQSILTSAAWDWESFIIDGETYLAVANSSNNSSGNVDSIIYKWNGTAFHDIQTIPTNGAHDWESFTIGSDTFLAVASYSNDSTWNINSKIYIWDGTSFIESQAIPTNGAIDWESFVIDGTTYLAVANLRDGENFEIDSKIYRSLVEINLSPIAHAGNDQSVHVGEVVTLDGSASTDPDGNYPLTFAWTKTSMPAGSLAEFDDPTSVSPSFTPDLIGDYIFKLVVTDSLGLSSSVDAVTVSTSNTAPVSNAGDDISVTVVGSNVTLDGSQSLDADGDELTFSWAFVSTPEGSSATIYDPESVNPNFTVAVYGEYIIGLTVNDGWADSALNTVTVTFSNIAPIANAGDNQSVIQGDTVYLNGGLSNDANGDPLTYNWNIVSLPEGSTAFLDDPTSETPSLDVDLAGEYVVNLTVNDGLLSSTPDHLGIVAISYQSAITDNLQQAIDVINLLDDSDFKRKKQRKRLTKKINRALKKIDNGKYDKALNIMKKRVLARMDGCALRVEPDLIKQAGKKKDWIVNCEAQDEVYPLILESIDLLNDFINN